MFLVPTMKAVEYLMELILIEDQTRSQCGTPTGTQSEGN